MINHIGASKGAPFLSVILSDSEESIAEYCGTNRCFTAFSMTMRGQNLLTLFPRFCNSRLSNLY